MESLYNRIGGSDGVLKVVVRLYDKILSDERLAPFFDMIDIEKLRRSQHAFVTVAVGGPHNYSGKDLIAAHARLVKQGLTDFHFNLVLFYLEESLHEIGVGHNEVEEVVTIVESTRDHVLGRICA